MLRVLVWQVFGEGMAEELGAEERPDSAELKSARREQKLTNQFNFSERASQTLNNPLRVGSSCLSTVMIQQNCFES